MGIIVVHKSIGNYRILIWFSALGSRGKVPLGPEFLIDVFLGGYVKMLENMNIFK